MSRSFICVYTEGKICTIHKNKTFIILLVVLVNCTLENISNIPTCVYSYRYVCSVYLIAIYKPTYIVEIHMKMFVTNENTNKY